MVEFQTLDVLRRTFRITRPRRCLLHHLLHYLMPAESAPLTSAHRAPSSVNGKRVLWSLLAVATLWVVLSNEVLLLIDYPLFREYRQLMIQDRALLIPHALFGCVAFFAGPLQFSSRLRQRRPGLHRLMGRSYVIAVYAAALTAFAIGWDRRCCRPRWPRA